jgi:hypothetical protein
VKSQGFPLLLFKLSVVLSSSGLVNNLCFCDLGHLVGLVDASLNGSSIYLYVRIPGSVQDYFYRSRVCADID